MTLKVRALTLGTLLLSLLFGGFIEVSSLAQPPAGGGPGPATGARQLLRSFFLAMGSSDLALLKNGGAISGTLQGDAFKVTLNSGKIRTLAHDDIAAITFGTTDQLVLSGGDTINGVLETDTLSIQTSQGSQLSLPKDEIQMAIFQLDLPTPGAGHRPNIGLFRVFQGLRSQNIFGLFAQALSSFDLAVFPGGQLWSGTVLNSEFSFTSALFGELSFSTAELSAIELAAEAGTSDFITLKTGDRLSGTIAEGSQIQFQPAGLVDENGAPVTLTLERGSVSQVTFRQPASAFGGGGHGPGFGGGPGK